VSIIVFVFSLINTLIVELAEEDKYVEDE